MGEGRRDFRQIVAGKPQLDEAVLMDITICPPSRPCFVECLADLEKTIRSKARRTASASLADRSRVASVQRASHDDLNADESPVRPKQGLGRVMLAGGEPVQLAIRRVRLPASPERKPSTAGERQFVEVERNIAKEWAGPWACRFR